MALAIRSPGFEHEHEIPKKYTCEGADLSPPLIIQGVPEAARSLVLIIDDPDAPDPKAPRRTFVHWVLYNLPPELREIPEGAGFEELPSGVRAALNDFQRPAYGGPCPPIGRHRYFHRLFALDVALPYLGADARRIDVDRAMSGHVVEQTVLLGTYEKSGV